jgi:uncharacterized protein with HEPN domain
MRNRLIHAYSDVNVGLVWSIIVSDLRTLCAVLKNYSPEMSKILPSLI